MGRGVYALQGMLYDATGERVTEVADLTRARLPAGPPQLAERRGRLRRRPGARHFRADAAARADDLPGPGAPDGDRRRHRPRPLRQRQQGHQRRRRPPGALQLSEGLLDRRRPAQGRRHRQPGRPLRRGDQGLSGRARPQDAFAATLDGHAPYAEVGDDGGRRPRRLRRRPSQPARTPSCCSRRPAPRSTSSPTSRSAARRSAPRCHDL